MTWGQDVCIQVDSGVCGQAAVHWNAMLSQERQRLGSQAKRALVASCAPCINHRHSMCVCVFAAVVKAARHQGADRAECRGVDLLTGLVLGELRASSRQLLKNLRALQSSDRALSWHIRAPRARHVTQPSAARLGLGLRVASG